MVQTVVIAAWKAEQLANYVEKRA